MNLTSERARADVAEVLYVEVSDLDHEEDLRDQGMDSVRVMELVERWRRAGVPDIDFILLAEDQRLSRWLELIESLQNDSESTP